MKGKVVILEGLDGVGKTLQIELLKQKFPEAIIFKYPTHETPELNAYLEKKKEIPPKELFHLFLKDIMKQQDTLSKAKESGKLVIVDRYVFSTIAYERDSFTYEEAKKAVIEGNFIQPDKVILLDLDAKTSQERKRKQKELDRYEADITYLEKVRKTFLMLAKDKFLCKEWHVLDAKKGTEEVNKEILGIIGKRA